MLHKNIPFKVFTKEDIGIAEQGDIPAWMDLMRFGISFHRVACFYITKEGKQ